MPALLAPAPAGTPVADHDPLLWLAPSPLWEGGALDPGDAALEQPHLVELTTDSFIPDFLAFLSGDDPDGEGPGGLGAHGPATGAGTTADPLVLYQPLHQRYYLVTGSLVCRRVGLPDRAVDAKREALSFVIRRLVDGVGSGTGGAGEQAWVGGTWVDVGDPAALVDGEEQHPMQRAPVTAPVATGAAATLLGLDEPGRRQLHYGFVPVAGRTARPATLTDAAAVAALGDADSDAAKGDDPRLMAFRLRVAGAWADMARRKDTIEQLPVLPPQFNRAQPDHYVLFEPSMFVLLDLIDWLGTYLPAVLTALVTKTALAAPGTKTARQALLDALEQVTMFARDPDHPSGIGKAMADTLAELEPHLGLLGGDPKPDSLDTQYDVTQGASPSADPLDSFEDLQDFIDALAGVGSTDGGLVHAALVEEDQFPSPGRTPAQVPPELSGMIVARPADPAQLDDRHVLRLVYQHEPCRPVVSRPSAVVRFAAVHDPDAPARQVRIQIPDPTNLRRFSRGIAIEMPPSLRKILDGVTPKLLKEEPLGEGSDWGIGMICAFSFQIFVILSFIVAFLMLIILNLVFWWLPFIKICFPIPVKKSQGGP